MSRALFGIVIATLMTSACTSYRGTDRLNNRLDPNFADGGKTSNFRDLSPQEAKRLGLDAGRSYGLRHFFLMDLKEAWDARRSDSEKQLRANKRMASSGVALIKVNCNEYFNEMGRNQRRSGTFRDLVTPVTSAIETAIALKLFSNAEDVNQNIGLGFGAISSAGVSALDIYDRRFLFSSENIDSVRTNTMKILSKNAEETLTSTPADFVDVIARLQQVEHYCTPSAILTNVRETLKEVSPQNEKVGGGKPGETVVEGSNQNRPDSGSSFVSTSPK